MAEIENDSNEKETFTGLARKLSRLSSEQKRAALEASASLAGVSLRVSREFVEAVPQAAQILSADDLRNWAEMGRRLAMGNAETGAKFFADGVENLKLIPEKARPQVFQICTRQLVLSSSIALETFELIPKLAKEMKDDELLTSFLKLASEIANRSAKHSSDFLHKSPQVCDALKSYGDEKSGVAKAVVALASNFANRTGGMTADLWANLPESLKKVSAGNAVRLTEKAREFLEFGGSVTLHFVSAGADVLQKTDAVFDEWSAVLHTIAKHGNAVLISFLRATPKFFAQIQRLKVEDEIVLARKVLNLVAEIAEKDAESALAAFRSSAGALKKVSLEQFEEWVETGLVEKENASVKARKSYFALETRQSNELLQEAQEGLPLEKIQTVLRIYVEGLTGKEVEIAPLSAMPQESRIGDGKTVYLPSLVNEFDSDDMDFRLYKVLAAHGAGQIEFGTFVKDTKELKAAFAELNELYAATAEQTDAFSLAGYIEDVQKGEKALSDEEIRAEENAERFGLPRRPAGFSRTAPGEKDFRDDGKRARRRRAAPHVPRLAQGSGLDAEIPARAPPVHFRRADESGAVRTVVPDHSVRRRDRRRAALLRADRFGNRNRDRKLPRAQKRDRRRQRDGDEPRLHALSKHHARGNAVRNDRGKRGQRRIRVRGQKRRRERSRKSGQTRTAAEKDAGHQGFV
jgi:hypothetical protein